MNDRKDSIKKNMSYWENKYEPINRKGFKSAEKDYQSITDAKEKEEEE